MMKVLNLSIDVDVMNTPIVVNLLAGAGAGKSTIAAAVFSLLKLHDIETELVTEFAKELIWEERFYTSKNQHYIFSKQQHRLWRVSNKVDVIITDSPAILRLVYNQEQSSDVFKQFVLEEFNAYNNMNFFLNRPKIYNEIGRNENKEEAKQIDKEILKVLDKHDIDYFVINSDFTAPNRIAESILNLFNKDIKIKFSSNI